jgi:glutaredoxin 3
MESKRKVEVFSAGCALCEEVIDVLRREAGSSSEVIVRNMLDARSLARAEKLGIRSVPAVRDRRQVGVLLYTQRR